jgi:type IV pilus assembly protein PilY1
MSRLLTTAVQSTALALLVAAAGFATPALAFESIHQTPLYLGGEIKPNFIMAIDDSISMGEERAFPQGNLPHLGWNPENQSFFKTDKPEELAYVVFGDGQTLKWAYYGGLFGDGNTPYFSATYAFPPLDSLGFARSPDFNRSYFNPAQEYPPWKKYDGQSWPDADPSAAHADPRPGADFAAGYGTLYDFTDQIGRKQEKDTGFFFLDGMTVPQGLVYRTASADPECFGLLPGTAGEWVELQQEFVAMEGCTVNTPYFPATFFLRSKDSLPAEFGYAVEPTFVPDALGPGGAGLYKYEIRPENFSSAETYNEAIGNFANWFQYHRNRFLVTVAAMTEALVGIRGVRVAQFQINNRVDVKMYDMDLKQDRAALYDKITSFQASAVLFPNTPGVSGTPNRDAVAHMGKQLQRTDDKAPIQAACQVNTGMLFTDGYTTQNTGPDTFGNADGALEAPFSDIYGNTLADIVTAYYEGAETPLRKVNDGFALGKVPVPASCSEGDPDPRIDCQENLHMRFQAIAYGPAGSIYGIQQAQTEDPFANPPDWNSLGSPKLKDTPIVIDELWHATLNGRGKFVNADKPAEIAQAMKDALATTAATSFSGGNAASSSRRGEGFLAYTPTYSTEDWTGDVSASTVNQDGTFAAKVWSAAAKLEALDVAERKVYFGAGKKVLKQFTFANIDDPVTALGLPSDTPYGRSVEEIVNYLRGDHSLEQKFPGGVLRDRSSRIGDIFGSQPEVLTTAGYGYSGLPEEEGGGVSGDSSYGKFVENKKNRTPVLFVGSNNGMLHAFNASATEDGGKELFSIIPNSVMKNLGKLPDPNYVHRYFVDGTPVQGDAFNGSAWKTVLLAPTGAGGTSIVALDVTDPVASFDESNFLWEFSDPDLHETIGKPNIVLLQDGTWAAVFGSGLDWGDPIDINAVKKAHVFVVNLFTGDLISKFKIADPSTKLAADGVVNVAPIDTDFDLKADTIYAPTHGGYVFRLDVVDGGALALGNGGEPIFQAVNSMGRPLMITGGIDSFPHHIRGQMVFFGTGRYLLKNADTNPALAAEAFFGIWDDPAKSGVEVTRPELQLQKILNEQDVEGLTFRQIEDHPIDWQTQRGWVVDLGVDGADPSGERFIGHPLVVLGKVIFPTFTPPAGCELGGVNRLYTLSATSGGGDYMLPGGELFGAVELTSSSVGGGPVIMPTLVATSPQPICIPGSQDCPVPVLVPDGEGNVTAAPSPGCRTALGMLLGDQMLDFANVSCGRQSWKQVR